MRRGHPRLAVIACTGVQDHDDCLYWNSNIWSGPGALDEDHDGMLHQKINIWKGWETFQEDHDDMLHQ